MSINTYATAAGNISLESIHKQSMALGVEGISMQVPLNFVKRLFPGFVNSVNGFFSAMEYSDFTGVPQISNDMVKKAMGERQYFAIADAKVRHLRGLRTTYLDYIEHLETSLPLIESFRTEVLGPFYRWVAVCINTPSTLTNMGTAIQGWVNHKDLLESQIESYGKHIDQHSEKEVCKYRELVDRNAEWEPVVKRTNNLVGRYLATSPAKVIEDVKLLAERLNDLSEILADNSVSGPTLKTLADYTYYLAREAEYYAQYGVMVKSLAVGLHETLQSIEDLK